MSIRLNNISEYVSVIGIVIYLSAYPDYVFLSYSVNKIISD